MFGRDSDDKVPRDRRTSGVHVLTLAKAVLR